MRHGQQGCSLGSFGSGEGPRRLFLTGADHRTLIQ
jgi:hypothetical protein